MGRHSGINRLQKTFRQSKAIGSTGNSTNQISLILHNPVCANRVKNANVFAVTMGLNEVVQPVSIQGIRVSVIDFAAESYQVGFCSRVQLLGNRELAVALIVRTQTIGMLTAFI